MGTLDQRSSQSKETAERIGSTAQPPPIAVPALVYFDANDGGIVRVSRFPADRRARAAVRADRLASSRGQRQMSRGVERVVSLLAAIGFTATIGLVAIRLDTPDVQRRDLPADARDQGAPGANSPAALPPMPREKAQPDRSVGPIDHGGD